MLIEVLVTKIGEEKYKVSTVEPERTKLSEIRRDPFASKEELQFKISETFTLIERHVGPIRCFHEAKPNKVLDYEPESILLKFQVWTEES